MRHGRICLGATAPPACSSRSCRGGSGVTAGLRFLECSRGTGSNSEVQEENLEWRPSWGLDSAWPLHSLMCVGAGEKTLPPILLPVAREEQDGKAAPRRTPGRAQAQPLPAVPAPVPVSLHMPCSQSIPGITAGEKKALSVKPRKSKDVNAPLESGDVSLFTKKTPGTEQGDLSVVSGLVRDRGCHKAQGGWGNAEGTEFPTLCFWECRGSRVKGKCCR